MSPLQALANYLDRQKRDLSGWVSNPSAQLERNVSNWTTPREGVISKGGLSRAAIDPSNSYANPGNWMGAGIIKNTGGNWLSGTLDNLHNTKLHTAGGTQYSKDMLDEMTSKGLTDHLAYPTVQRGVAVNSWIDKQLTRYIKNQMGTEADPIRKLADQGVMHYGLDQFGGVADDSKDILKGVRASQKMPVDNIATSELGKHWEDVVDFAIHPTTVGRLKGSTLVEPWMSKVDPNTPIYGTTGDINDLGFDHIVDSIKHHLNTGVYTPDTLTNLSIERAVRDTHAWNKEMADELAKSQELTSSYGTLHKDYGDGMKWVELAPAPKSSAKVVPLENGMFGVASPDGKLLNGKWNSEDKAQSVLDEFSTNPNYPDMQSKLSSEDYNNLSNALKYEGDTMGHCVGGYCDSVANGGSRIFSLRDSNNKPHVTIETSPVPDHSWSSIVQIKGKRNTKPVDKYIPYVQDFVKSGKWDDIGDYSNTDLIRKSALTPEEQTLFPDQNHFTLDEVKALRQGKDWKPIDNDPELGLEYHPDWLADD